jgi:hypothetical protein
MRRPLPDRLIDMCVRESDEIAEHWYQALTQNPRTKRYRSLSKLACLRLATSIYKNMGAMYLSENPYETVEQTLDGAGFAEDQYARGIPLEEVIYGLILMRREIWFHSERASLFNVPDDMYELVVGINRVLLLFDYAAYIVASRYRSISGSTAPGVLR